MATIDITNQDLATTPTGMAPAVDAAAFVWQQGHQMIAEAANPFLKSEEGFVPDSLDPIAHREWRLERIATVKAEGGP